MTLQRDISSSETRILLRKTRRKILCSPENSHFPSQNKEENPLLVGDSDFASQNKEDLE